MAQSNISAVIDIGSAETKVFIVDLEPQLKIVGAFSAKTEGMRRGEIFNLGALKESVHGVIRQAELQAGSAGEIRRACLAVSGTAVGGFAVQGVTSVKSRSVSAQDERAAEKDALDVCLHRVPENRRIVRRIFRGFRLDREREIIDPRGLSGNELFYDMWVVDAEESHLLELYQIPNRYGMEIDGLFPASLAAAESVRSFSEMDKNRLVIDIGAGTSDFALFRDGRLALTGVIPVGGEHVTSDISHGLQIRQEDAERLKLRYAKAIACDEDVPINIDLDTFECEMKVFSTHVSRYKMELIVQCRLEELFGLIRKKVEADEPFSGVVQLTGGTSQMLGVCELAGRIFRSAEVRAATPNQGFAPNYADPKYATVVGLAVLYRDELRTRRKSAGPAGGLRRFLKKIIS